MSQSVCSSTFHFFLILHFLFSQASKNPDLEPLLAFKASTDKANKLTTWNSTSNPCTWTGVSCLHDRVSRLVLEDLDLQGSFESLTALTQLRVLSLKQNRLSGPIPDLSNLTALKLLFLSHNDFSGQFPPSMPTLFRLYRLDLSYNNFSGEVPVSVSEPFSGSISGLNLPNLQEFNVSGNRFSGEIPKSLSGFPISAFAQNLGLCGSPIQQKCKSLVSDPTRPGSVNGAIASPLIPGTNPTSTVSSSPSSVPSTRTTSPSKSENTGHAGTSKISPVALIAIILGDALVLAVVSLILYCYFWRNYASKMRDGHGKSSKLLESEKIVYSSSPYPAGAQSGFEKGRMMFFEGVRRFELEDLLRASAEMLGKGGFGTAYKAVLDDGNVVAVKRLKDASVGGKREFEQHMEVLGRLRHPNVVSLRAYYFAREEKLLVYDYMPNGSLFWLLHAGAARGLAFIHNSCRSLKLTHGNIKSTNILLDKTGNAHVSDFGLSVFAAPTNGAHGPTATVLQNHQTSKTHSKSDVYSFGVLLLELLTGKCPSVVDNGGGPGGGGYISGVVDLPRWVQSVVREEWTAEVFDLELMRYKDIEEEMMIDEIRGVEVSPGHDTVDYLSESPSMSEDTCGASQ
ncbi:hypothetical protein RGQ29_000301 [Quercus rubra]|uniref:Protein kinase domain-containing protein n=1 Tax=Quercus rubra TaxID=3512 RepID=A0AAN7G9R7_QUERU|nr:hypothetical protein RGQ29_000301 [Quercus rubra]